MSIANLSLNTIYYAISALEREAEGAYYRAVRSADYDRARDLRRTAAEAMKDYSALSQNWDRIKALSYEAERAYDAHVTRPPREDDGGCSCHLNAPCGWCTRQVDEDESTPEASAERDGL